MQSASSKKKILVKSFPLQGNDFFIIIILFTWVSGPACAHHD
jgi:hypothetical protein